MTVSLVPDTDRYATLRRLSWYDHDRIRGARVLVAGAGALGNGVLQLLALYGIGEVVIVDNDTIEPTNLSRSPLFRPNDVGRPKAEVAAEKLRAMNPDVRTRAIVADLTSGVGLGEYRHANVVFGCVDSRISRLAINRACWRVNIPWIEGGIDVWVGVCRVFSPPDGPCYACTMTEVDRMLVEQRFPCTPSDPTVMSVPTLPTTAAVVAALQVQEAIKLLHGIGAPGEGVFFDGQTNSLRRIKYSRLDDCYAHETYSPIETLHTGSNFTLGELLSHAGKGAVLRLERQVLRSFGCAVCGTREMVYRPYDEVDKLNCPQCGTTRAPDVVSRLARSESGDSVSLSSLGIPARHVVHVDVDGRSLFFELADSKEAENVVCA